MFTTKLICSWIGGFGLAAGAFCQTYVPINLGYSTLPAAINEAGVVAGRYIEHASTPPIPPKPAPTLAFVRDAVGVITRINLGSGFGTYAFRINAAGATTGSYLTGGGARGFVRDPAGNFTFFDVPTGNYTYPSSINAGGAVTGNSGNYGFLRDADGTITSFDVPGSLSTTPVSINEVGIIAGNYQQATAFMDLCVTRREMSPRSILQEVWEQTRPASITQGRSQARTWQPTGTSTVLCATRTERSRRSTRELVHSRLVSTATE